MGLEIFKTSFKYEELDERRLAQVISTNPIFKSHLSTVELNRNFINSLWGWDLALQRFGEDSKGKRIGNYLYLQTSALKALLLETANDAHSFSPEYNQFTSGLRGALQACVSENSSILALSSFADQEFD